ncbi:GntR family transcriptional regulator [Photobacterium lipolyticum]|uniref:Transcriptional regulator n=1 Tax=Photobacterium lipolyticum TaxID=266810 RepID=A0A2T3MYG4_9GAMM|nr:GntR family transcriptional regulator [Photobacterium lipolyticum]PSW05028.1 transcriptional regulator [Photobacterium lipolyticum]
MEVTNYVDATRERFEAWLLKANLPTGAKLPSERELCELLDTKRMTLRQVLIELEVESRIFRKNRSGWFITPSRFVYNPKALSSFNAEAIKQGRQPFWGYLEQDLAQSLPSEIKQVFPLKENTYKVTGWCGLDKHKVFYHESYIDANFAPDFIKKLKGQSFAKVWEEEYGQVLTLKKLSFKPVNMHLFACKELGVAPNSFGILIEKHRATSDKKVVQVDLEYWRFESVELVIEDL